MAINDDDLSIMVSALSVGEEGFDSAVGYAQGGYVLSVMADVSVPQGYYRPPRSRREAPLSAAQQKLLADAAKIIEAQTSEDYARRAREEQARTTGRRAMRLTEEG